ncbi:hypothetical protein CALCODRAFT_341445 [Calocera cornea HHB12733]|uniref:Secreted protein n=1 Tax=Calocera cornea HHB12733 TaxID=1353952 RepID=A0A165EYD4_9BASI|nr:hypothetical protein CALCODRAFT_341445 [Calocera cornea HHB12733]
MVSTRKCCRGLMMWWSMTVWFPSVVVETDNDSGGIDQADGTRFGRVPVGVSALGYGPLWTPIRPTNQSEGVSRPGETAQ